MRLQLFHCALVLVTGAAAFGCGSTYEPAQPHTASYVKTADAKSAKKTQVSPLNHAMHPNAPADPHAAHGPISLTGEVPYAERFDPSGWSGTSTPPEGVGGGPSSNENAENPYDETATPTPSANGANGSVEGLAPTDSLPPPGSQKPGADKDLTPTPPTNVQKDLDTTPTPPPSDEQPPQQ